MAGKLPYYPMYVEAFSDGVISMNLSEVGLYILALGHAWKHGSIPDDADELARLIRQKPTDVRRAWPALRPKWSESEPGKLVNERQEEERARAISKSQKATNSIRTRYEKSTNVGSSVPTDEHTNVDIRAYESVFSSKSSSEKEKNQEVAALWLNAGFAGPEDFDVWWLQVVENHPNKTKNAYAKSELFELIVNRQFIRGEFEDGYSQLSESKGDEWTKEAGKYCTNLYEIIHNRLWKFKADVKADWVRELEQEQALERREHA